MSLKSYKRPSLRDKHDSLTNEELREEIEKVNKKVVKETKKNGK